MDWWNSLTKSEKTRVVLGMFPLLTGMVTVVAPLETIPFGEKAPLMALVGAALMFIIALPSEIPKQNTFPKLLGSSFAALAGIFSAWFWLSAATEDPLHRIALVMGGVATVVVILTLWWLAWLPFLRARNKSGKT